MIVRNGILLGFTLLLCLPGQLNATKQHGVKTDIKPAVMPKNTKQTAVAKTEKKEQKKLVKTEQSQNRVTSLVPEKPLKLSAADRRKRKTLHKKPKRHTLRDMTYEELKEHKIAKLNENDVYGAIRYAEKMLPMCQDMHELRDLSLELADLLFKNGDLEKAGKLYTEFAKLYPGNEKVEYAYYRAITCSTHSILEPTRDQTATHDTLNLANKYLERSDVFLEHRDEIAKIKVQCIEHLVKSEFAIIDYYFNRGRFKAVQNRINGLRKLYVDQLLDLEPRLLTLEINLALKQNNLELHTIKLAERETKFPEYSANLIVAQAKNKTPLSDRF